MKTNIGYVDRAIRFVVGLIIVWVAFDLKSTWGIAGFYPLVTAYLGICPIYHLFHLSTIHPLKE